MMKKAVYIAIGVGRKAVCAAVDGQVALFAAFYY